MKDIEKAIEMLKGNICLAIVNGNTSALSGKPGIAALLDYISESNILMHSSVADKIVGRAAALLFVRAKVKEVYGRTMSKPASEILTKYGIPHSYDTLTDHILNRRGDGKCPMDMAIENIDNPDEAYKKLVIASAKLKKR